MHRVSSLLILLALRGFRGANDDASILIFCCFPGFLEIDILVLILLYSTTILAILFFFVLIFPCFFFLLLYWLHLALCDSQNKRT